MKKKLLAVALTVIIVLASIVPVLAGPSNPPSHPPIPGGPRGAVVQVVL